MADVTEITRNSLLAAFLVDATITLHVTLYPTKAHELPLFGA